MCQLLLVKKLAARYLKKQFFSWQSRQLKTRDHHAPTEDFENSEA